jgi:hypothetical protein
MTRITSTGGANIPSTLSQAGPSTEPTRSLGKSPERPATLEEGLAAIKQDLNVLARLRTFGGGSHPTYLTNENKPSCCDETGPHGISQDGISRTGKPKDEKVGPDTLNALKQFSEGFAKGGKFSRASKKPAGYLNTIQAYAQLMLDRSEDPDLPVVRHDINILVSETIAEVLGKLTKHPGDEALKDEAGKVLQSLGEHFGQFLIDSKSEYRSFFQGTKNRLLSGAEMLGKMENYLNQVDSAHKTHSSDPVSRPEPREAYQAAAGIILSENKPAFLATRVVGKRVDRHNHPDPYDANGELSKISPLDWHARINESLGVHNSDMMAIPHRMTAASFNGRDPTTIKDNTRHAYYSDVNAKTEFWAKDKTLIAEYNRLTPEQREVLNVCCTSTPVNPTRLPEIQKVAQQFAKNVALGQLNEGRQHIEVTFGEITGYKPAVPQSMLTDGVDGKPAKQEAFINGSADVLTAVFEAGQAGIADALKQFAADGKSLEGIQTKVRTVYHSDALPTEAATEREANLKADGTHKEITTMGNIAKFAHEIDSRLSKSSAKFPAGVTHEHHLQCAHLMGASIEPNNFLDAGRATEMHRAFREFRKNFGTLRVTADASWLTASARAMNFGMAEFFGKSKDKDLKQIADLIETADKLSNDGFMQLHGGERYFETHLLNGNETDGSVLDMALMRAAQKKVVRTYHTVLGALSATLDKPGVTLKVQDHIKRGVNKEGLVVPGNYPGLFLNLDKEAVPGSRQDPTPIVWGTDNLTPAEARSGDLKVLQYSSQHAPFEIILAKLGDIGQQTMVRRDSQTRAANVLRRFLTGPQQDEKFLGSKAQIPSSGVYDGPHPADPNSDPNPKRVDDQLFNVRAPQDMVMPWPNHRDDQINAEESQRTAPPDDLILDPSSAKKTSAGSLGAMLGLPPQRTQPRRPRPVLTSPASLRQAILGRASAQTSNMGSLGERLAEETMEPGVQTPESASVRDPSEGRETASEGASDTSSEGWETASEGASDTSSVRSWTTAPESATDTPSQRRE